MITYLDCIPCLIRQCLEALRRVTADRALHEQILRDLLSWAAVMDLDQPPPAQAQRIHRRLRAVTGVDDPYYQAKVCSNRMALDLLPTMREKITDAADPLETALRLAIAGNVIDLGVQDEIDLADVEAAIQRGLAEPLGGDPAAFRQRAAQAKHILYLADNAGEIVFDRLLIEQLGPHRVVLAVRGAPILNDVTRADAEVVGLADVVTVIDNGSDAPGTLLADCKAEFRREFAAADMIIAKGQGNYETLSAERGEIYFLFKAKCKVIAAHTGFQLGTHVVLRAGQG